ncbi:MAG: 2-hydroxyacyl-CoA dehydratase [Desulfobacteraceae bacterium]|jgi:benzoyl-CoA reductase/2-hydroxyglutaryl-CoA dehydratase subunit BcrC/BadD/HgdB|nr:MAG: 2-hydroxyacyl-CoA dehydratase [Desulfobacteraceae bacterium]
MTENDSPRIGFACAYTPLPLIRAAGFIPYRILPIGDWPDQAGQMLHDNLCPHVKRILDRAMADDLPDLAGMVFVNSCDAMRRMMDAWKQIRPKDKTVMIDLPATAEPLSIDFLAGEFRRLVEVLSQWSGYDILADRIKSSMEQYDLLASRLRNLHNMNQRGMLSGGSGRMQAIYNQAATQQVEALIADLDRLISELTAAQPMKEAVPVFMFGNILPDPAAFDLIESCGARVAGDDFCTGARLFGAYETQVAIKNDAEDVFHDLARRVLTRPPCARTFDPAAPMRIAEDVVDLALACNAKGVIGHTVKFCDPYLARVPVVREALTAAGLPFLMLEGDCTLRSMEQQRTRIEAFIEMLC